MPRDVFGCIYRDLFYKFEIICALMLFDVLCGFCLVGVTVELLRAFVVVGVCGLVLFVEVLLGVGIDLFVALVYVVGFLLMMLEGDRWYLVGEMVVVCVGYDGLWLLVVLWMVWLVERYLGDVGVVVVLLLNCVRFEFG